MKRYYTINKNGKIKFDKVTTYINNNEWTLTAVFLIMLIITGIIEAL